MKKRERTFLIIGILLLVGDLLTKYYFFNQKLLSDSIFFEPVMNFGVSFSRTLSYLVVIPATILAIGFFVYFYKKKEFSDIVLMLLIAGTLGNLFDRIVYYGVRDFIVVLDFFVCNLADIYLSCAILLVMYRLISKKKTF